MAPARHAEAEARLAVAETVAEFRAVAGLGGGGIGLFDRLDDLLDLADPHHLH